MKTRAALLWEAPGPWRVEEVELDPPKEGEVLVHLAASGLCHSDDHFAKGDIGVATFPFVGGHEGAGVVEAVGPGVHTLRPGDHIVSSFIASCGHCRWCAGGWQNLCDNGAKMLEGSQLDGTFRMHVDGRDVGQGGLVSTFSEWSVMPAVSCVKVDDDVPFEVACLVGCGVPTGWGSASRGAGIAAGDVVVVMGTGGVGMNAVQGARYVGATRVIAVDPVPFKRELALKLGATDAFADIGEAADVARRLTGGHGADAAIVTVGVVTGEHVAAAFSAIRKGGTVVVTSAAGDREVGIPVPLLELAMYQKRIQGAIYGMGSPVREIPLLIDLYRRGDLKLDELVTRTYPLDEINQAYEDMHAGLNIRGVVTFGWAGQAG
jgi:S-(hydroxymethyl)glutathione dehydrogenase/alcohol dehydrogenase